MGKRGSASSAAASTPVVKKTKSSGLETPGGEHGSPATPTLGGASAEDAELASLASVNAPVWTHFQTMLTVIKGHFMFEKILEQNPPEITNDDKLFSGVQAPFDLDNFNAAMHRNGEYLAAQNFFRHCMLFTSTPRVRYRPKAIAALKQHHFGQGPARFPLTLEVAVGTGKHPLLDLDEVKRITPEELEFAYVEAIYDAVQAEASQEVMADWFLSVLTVPYRYRRMDSEDAVAWAANQYRESLDQNWASLHHTTLQKIRAVVYMIKKQEKTKGKLTTPQIVKLFKDNLQTSTGASGDKDHAAVSAAFIDTAVTVYDRVLKDSQLAKIMMDADDDPNNPFDSWTKIQTIIGKASSPEGLAWAFGGTWDMHKRGELHNEGVSLRNLQGRMPNSGGKGLVDLLLYKKGLCKYFLGE